MHDALAWKPDKTGRLGSTRCEWESEIKTYSLSKRTGTRSRREKGDSEAIPRGLDWMETAEGGRRCANWRWGWGPRSAYPSRWMVVGEAAIPRGLDGRMDTGRQEAMCDLVGPSVCGLVGSDEAIVAMGAWQWGAQGEAWGYVAAVWVRCGKSLFILFGWGWNFGSGKAQGRVGSRSEQARQGPGYVHDISVSGSTAPATKGATYHPGGPLSVASMMHLERDERSAQGVDAPK
ncbi:hypothetical protein B0H11DRAFT_2208561 [Mycena galericulata]|nr:hypothetical protein B0H11DRAFT_2208561 [Mycena galericulata]